MGGLLLLLLPSEDDRLIGLRPRKEFFASVLVPEATGLDRLFTKLSVPERKYFSRRHGLTAVSVACLTVYDMVKAVDRGMRIEGIRLIAKDGGRSGAYRAPQE